MLEAAKRDVAEIETIVAQLRGAEAAQELAQEVLGAERAHLENLETMCAAHS